MSVYLEEIKASTSYPPAYPNFDAHDDKRISGLTDEKFHELESAPPPPPALKPVARPQAGSSAYRTVSGILGFKEKYSLFLMFVFGGALFAFCLARTFMMSPANIRDKTTPGEWFWYQQKLYLPNIIIHIYGTIIGGLFAGFQFVPAIRRRNITFHRLNGYFVVLTIITGTVCGAIVARRAVGGEINVQSAFYCISSLIVYSAVMGIATKSQTRKHRKWMLRCVTYVCAPVTARLIMFSARQIVSNIGTYYSTWRCDEVLSVLGDRATLDASYPQCANISNLGAVHVAVLAKTQSHPLNYASSIRVTFGMALWIGLLIHFIGIEYYLRATESMNQHRRGFVLERVDEGYAKSDANDH